jgi:hypothetical protein
MRPARPQARYSVNEADRSVVSWLTRPVQPGYATRGLQCVSYLPDPDIREAAEEFRDPAKVELIRANLTKGLTGVYPELGGLDRRESDQQNGNR